MAELPFALDEPKRFTQCEPAAGPAGFSGFVNPVGGDAGKRRIDFESADVDHSVTVRREPGCAEGVVGDHAPRAARLDSLDRLRQAS